MWCCKITKGNAWLAPLYVHLVLPFLHVPHVKQHDFAAKSVFEYFIVFLNKPQCMRFIYMNTMLVVQTESVTG